MTTTLPRLPHLADDMRPVILVVEDEVLVRLAAAQHLREAGWQVVEACTADEALRLLRRADVDVVFTDITMPGARDGLQLVDWLRTHRPEVRTIVASATPRPDPSCGAFLGKPYRLSDLERCLAGTLEGCAARHAPRTRQLAPLQAD